VTPQRLNESNKEKGQAMVFSLLFLAVAIMTLLILYNQGQLVKNRVQLENAADAAVYSQAKLAARNLNFIAYTNRAMVANEVSIGQMVALLSWVKHYKNVGAFSFFPLYTVPIAPPSPTTLQSIMAPVTTLYTNLGTALEPPLRQVNKVWPTAISYFNGALGIFQKVFALSTLEAEIEMNLHVVEDHEFSADKPEMYTPVVGWYFFVQNTLLTYFGENVDPSSVYGNVSGKLDANTDNADTQDMVGDFLGEQLGTIDNMINDNTSGVSRKKANNASGGQNANMNTGADDTGDGAVDGYKRFAAIVNNNREAFTRDRHWDLGPPRATFSFPLNLDIGIVKLTIKLDLGFWMGIKNDGGTAYVSHGSMEENKDIASLGWSALDVTSFGIQIDIGLFVSFEVCLPIVGCNGGTIIDVDFSIPIGLPLAGATHQLVSDRKYAKKVVPEWGYPMMPPDVYGGDITDVLNQGSFDLFHLLALGWGSIAPQLPGGMFGVNPNDVTDSYSGPPSFFSLGDSFQESGVGYEFVIALAKTMDEIETTDKSKPSESGSSPSSLNINTGAAADWDDVENNPVSYTRFDVESHSRVEGKDISADYQELIWNDDRPMMTVSAAETYFADPMQKNKDGSDVAPSLFSPFWDARLKEPSAMSMLIATGEIKWSDIFEGLSDNASASDIIDWVLQGIAERVIDVGVDTLVEQIDDPIIGPLVEPTIKDVASQATDAAIEQLPDFDSYMPQ
tara:strand:+ start:376837 stop:379035 length:2199 start_codon:yes stop_codon:yes gene_type:complete